jgi:hypothetical protein
MSSGMNRPQYWKDELNRELIRLRRLLDGDEPGCNGPEDLVMRSMALEKFAFVTAYMARKLSEAEELTLEVTESEWPVQEFRCTVPPAHRKWFAISEDRGTWRQPLEQHYDLAHPRATTLSFRKICDYLIHHFAFETRLRAGNRVQILFKSDRSSGRLLYSIVLDDYMGLVAEVVFDEVVWVDMSRDEGRVIQRRSVPWGES